VAFFRFNRDKRGYEHFFLVEPVTNRRGKTRPRVLYWYRTPPNVRVGRAPFDEDVRRALEAQHPSVVFDWPKIVDAPIPSADVEKWRERRRAEKAEKAARRQHASIAADLDEPAGDPADVNATNDDAESIEQIESVDAAVDDQTAAPSADTAQQVRKRRRRRRGRGQHSDRSVDQNLVRPAVQSAEWTDASGSSEAGGSAPTDPTTEPAGK
jgi:hypothetical protein